MRIGRTSWIGLLLVAPLAAQSPVVRADSAWASGDRALARRLYAEALARDPENSHAVYRAAELSPEPAEAIRYLRRYTLLEPGDPWGWMALGNRLSRLGKTSEALEMYGRAERLAPGERDVVIGRARVLSRGGDRDRAIAEYDRWLSTHDTDGEAWSESGKEWLRAGQPGRALKAFKRAEALGRHDITAQRELAAAEQAPALEPNLAYQRDSDGNRTTRFGLLADVATGDATRLGLAGRQSNIGDGSVTAATQEAGFRLGLRPKATTRITLSGGATRLAPKPAGNEWITPTGEFRLRWHAPGPGASLDLKAERMALGTTPLLVTNHAVRNEGKVLLELPLGPFRARGGGRIGVIQASGTDNTRWGADGMLAVPIGGMGEVSAQYHRMHYASATTAGYFAPDRVETLEAGSYLEVDGGGISLAADLGAGAQRVSLHGASPGPWRATLRGWAYVGIPLAPGRDLHGELEAYDAPFAPDAVTTSSNWRYLLASVGVRLAIR